MTEQLQWFKSRYSDDGGGNCVEVALPASRSTVHIRDSKNPTGPQLRIAAPAWTAFVSAAQPGA